VSSEQCSLFHFEINFLMNKMNHSESTPRFKTSPGRRLRVRDRQGKWRRICDYVEVAGEGREEQNTAAVKTKVVVVIDFNDSHDHRQQITMPRRHLLRPREILDELMDNGFNVPPADRDVKLLCTYLRTATATDQYTLVYRIGWVNRSCYLRPDREFSWPTAAAHHPSTSRFAKFEPEEQGRVSE